MEKAPINDITRPREIIASYLSISTDVADGLIRELKANGYSILSKDEFKRAVNAAIDNIEDMTNRLVLGPETRQ